MKNILLIIILGLISHMGYSQKVTIDCPGNVEVGIPATFTAFFDNEGKNGITVTRYEWSVPFNGDGISGSRGIEGNTNGEINRTEPYKFYTNSTSNTITVQWGDFFDLCADDVNVIVFYELTGSEKSIPASCNVDIFCVQSPVISGISSIQECCNDIMTFCDDSNGAQDMWTWVVLGGKIIYGQGTQCIDVIPDLTGSLSVS